MTIDEVAEILGMDRRRAVQLMLEHDVEPITVYPIGAILAIQRWRSERKTTDTKTVPSDARLPVTVVHEPTAWEVHPADGTVWSYNGTAPRELGFPRAGQMCAQQRWGSERREWRLGRVVWEAVNGRPVPDGYVVIQRNGDFRDLRYPNLRIEPQAPITDDSHPSSGKRKRGNWSP